MSMAANNLSSDTQGAAPASSPVSGNVRLIGSPCQARNINSGLVLEDGGKSYLVIGNMNETSNMELIFIDTEAGTGNVYRAPAGSGAWALQPIPGNRLAVGTFYDGMFMVFDIGKREWVHNARLSNEQYVWTFAVGSDGRVYGGSYPGARLGAMDPHTYAVEDLGRPGTKENLYLRYTSALPDGRIFCQCGFDKPQTFLFDPATKQFTPAPEALQKATAGLSWNGYFVVGNTAYTMPDLKEASPSPFPVPDKKDGAWAPDPRLSTHDTLVLRQGRKLWRYRAGDTALSLWLETPERGVGAIFGVTNKGVLVGIRGQDFFTLKPGDKAVTLARIPGESSPRETHFLYADDHGRLWGGPTFGQTLFYVDLATGNATNTGIVSDSGGEVYDVEVVDGITYAVAYAGGEMIRFDPADKWDQLNHVNPKTVVRVGPDYIRPSAGVMRGPDGKLYTGWLAKYGTYGGTLAITDLNGYKTEIVKDPLGPHGISGCAAIDGGRVLLGSTTGGNGLAAQKGQDAAFGVYDQGMGKTVFTHPFPGAGTVSNIVWDPKSKLAALIAAGQVWLFDTQKMAFVGDGPAISEKINGALVIRDGHLLYGSGSSLLSRDLSTVSGATATLATLPGRVDKIAVSPSGGLFVACGPAIYEVKA